MFLRPIWESDCQIFRINTITLAHKYFRIDAGKVANSDKEYKYLSSHVHDHIIAKNVFVSRYFRTCSIWVLCNHSTLHNGPIISF